MEQGSKAVSDPAVHFNMTFKEREREGDRTGLEVTTGEGRERVTFKDS
jgi:hypothetical protein